MNSSRNVLSPCCMLLHHVKVSLKVYTLNLIQIPFGLLWLETEEIYLTQSTKISLKNFFSTITTEAPDTTTNFEAEYETTTNFDALETIETTEIYTTPESTTTKIQITNNRTPKFKQPRKSDLGIHTRRFRTKKYRKTCHAVSFWKNTAGFDDWCNLNCNHRPSYCPKSHCKCDWNTQCASRILNRISKIFIKTIPWLKCLLHGFRICSTSNPRLKGKGSTAQSRQLGQFCPCWPYWLSYLDGGVYAL